MMPGDEELNTTVMLLVFLGLIIQVLYLVSLALVLARRGRKLIQLARRKYYLTLALHCTGRLIICLVVSIQLAVGLASQLTTMTPNYVETIFKNALVFDDLSLLLLLFLALKWHCDLSFRALKPTQPAAKWALCLFSPLLLLTLITLLSTTIVYDLSLISYQILDYVLIGFNGLGVLCLCSLRLYLSIAMTGVMMPVPLKISLKLLHKLLLILLFSRLFALSFQVTVAILVPEGTFYDYIHNVTTGLTEYEVFAVTFVTTLLLTLLSEGLPVMYSLRQSVVTAMDYKDGSDISRSLVTESSVVFNDDGFEEISLRDFRDLHEINGMHAVWVSYRAWFDNQEFFLRRTKHEVSGYITEDIEDEVARWVKCSAPPMCPKRCFYEKNNLWVAEPALPLNLDAFVDQQNTESKLHQIAVKVAQAVRYFHDQRLVHGGLKPSHILSDKSGIIYINGFGYNSLKKYVSLISTYSDKGLYTAVEHLRERGTVTVRATAASDVYSLGIILFQVLTKNRQYRELNLIEINSKFSSENFRPKLVDNIDNRIKMVIRRCWHEDPAQRPSAAHVAEELKAITMQE